MNKSIDKIGAYDRVSEITETNNAYLFDVQGPDAKIYFAKVPKNLDASSSAARQFSSVARHLKKINSDYINKVIDSGDEASSGFYFMILEKIEGARTLEEYTKDEIEASASYLKYILQVWYSCSEALDLASSKNIFHKDLHPRNILINRDKKPIIIDFGISLLEHTISKKPLENEFSSKFSAPEFILKEESRLQCRTDFYSLSLCIMYALLGHRLFYEDENNESRLTRIVDLYRPYISQSSLDSFLELFRKSFHSDPNLRYYRYSELRDAINNLFEAINHTPEKSLALHIDINTYVEEFIRDLNENGVSITVNELRHAQNKNIVAKMASKKFLANTCFFSNKGNCLEIRGLKKIDSLEENEIKNHNWVISKGTKLSGINFISKKPLETNIADHYDVFNLLEKLFIDNRDTTRSSLPKNSRAILKTYLTLLQEEINYLRNDAFKVKYSEFEINDSNEAYFKILPDEKTSAEQVNNFLKRSQASFRKGTEIVLNASEDELGLKSKQNVGYSTRYDHKHNLLFIKDFPQNKKDEIPKRGYLIEDTSLLEIQFKRQINAIKNFEIDNVTNSET